MVKLLLTPFGEYGYVLTGSSAVTKPICESTPGGRPVPAGKVAKPKVPTTYDAKYLRTTNLSKGSDVVKMRDRESYMKRGLLHQGQEPVVALEFQLPRNLLTAAALESRRSTRTGVNDRKMSSHESLPAVKSENKVAQKWKDVHSRRHAGTATVQAGKRGFARRFAESRSNMAGLAGIPPSGGDVTDSGGAETRQREAADDRTESSLVLPELVKLDQDQMPFSLLGRLKSKRLREVYSDMLRKHRENRLRLIMDKVDSAEQIRQQLQQTEQDRQRRKLKTSVASQRSQLRELRSRHKKDFESRLASIYCVSGSAPSVLSLPRDVYGLPEDEDQVEAPASRRKPRLSQSKISLQSLRKADGITSKFNNVWNLLNSPRRPQTMAAVDVAA